MEISLKSMALSKNVRKIYLAKSSWAYASRKESYHCAPREDPWRRADYRSAVGNGLEEEFVDPIEIPDEEAEKSPSVQAIAKN